MNALLHWLSGFLPARYINDGQVRYLERYYVGTLLGWRFYLHRFVGSDPDRGLHNHKWHAVSFVLSGWYWEERAWGSRKVRWFNRLNPDTFHRVVLPFKKDRATGLLGPELKPCWTLFAHRAENDVQHWGFRRDLEHAFNPGAWYLQPYRYEREGSQADWWLTAPTGRELRGAIIHKAAADA